MSSPLQLPGWRHVYSGKVRDLYLPDPDGAGVAGAGGADVVLVVASDRISAYDHVLATSIPDKGRVLTALTVWWFERLADVVPNHLVSTDVPAAVAGRAMICRRLAMVPVECVARGYLAGSGLTEYRAGRRVCGVWLPDGLDDGSRLPEPIFTPAHKADLGEHDENITFEQVAERIGPADATRLRELTLTVYRRAEAIARQRGIVLADTKFEFGRPGVGREPSGGSRAGRLRARGRGAHPGLVPVLAARRMASGPHPAELRQAVRARLAHLARQRLGPRRRHRPSAAAGGRRRAHP